ncbi:ABC transporter permease [Anaerolineae bacterium CFX9]|nr:ABC transporter permease [Anaerolineae bacterium CFX9]
MQADVQLHPKTEVLVPVHPRVRQRSRLRRLAPLAGIAGLILIWQALWMLRLYPEFIIPAPISVFNRLLDVIVDGRLAVHIGVTLGEIALGLAVGLSVAIILGYLLAKSQVLDAILSPLIVAVQAIPVVAYAPLLVIWFGTGTSSKVVTCALIVFFPMLMNTFVGIRDVPSSLQDLMRSLQATRWQMFTRLEVPAALPILFGGLKVSATLSVIGVVVGEFISADAGLGYLLKVARQAYDTPLVFVAVLTLAVIARILYGAVAILERRALRWKPNLSRS